MFARTLLLQQMCPSVVWEVLQANRCGLEKARCSINLLILNIQQRGGVWIANDSERAHFENELPFFFFFVSPSGYL